MMAKNSTTFNRTVSSEHKHPAPLFGFSFFCLKTFLISDILQVLAAMRTHEKKQTHSVLYSLVKTEWVRRSLGTMPRLACSV